jgi:hypothetical protein
MILGGNSNQRTPSWRSDNPLGSEEGIACGYWQPILLG